MKKVLGKDKSKRSKFQHLESKKLILKSFLKNGNLSYLVRWSASGALDDLACLSKSNDTVKRCILTGRKSKISKDFNVSRLSFLKLSRKGLIYGVKKLSR